MLKSYKIYTCTNGALGLHLSRAPWDPYPWVSSIQKDSTSYQAGLRIGDCLLELNGQDVLGMKISEIAAILKNHWLNESSNYVTVVIWRNKCNASSVNATDVTNSSCNEVNNGQVDDVDDDDDEDEENNAHNINQQSLQKFATCLQHIAQLLECPVCLEVIKPPGWQCCNGHVLCNNCRSRSEKCPVCRVPLGPRGRCLLSDKLFTLLADSFPCDGVRSNKNSPKDRRKCSTEFHNQPKMAISHKQQQKQQEKEEHLGAKKAKDFLITSLRQRRRKISTNKTSHDDDNNDIQDQRLAEVKEQQNKHPSMQKQFVNETKVVATNGTGLKVSSIIQKDSSNRKSSADNNNSSSSGSGCVSSEAFSTGNVKGVSVATFRCHELLEQTPTLQQCLCATCYKPDKVAIVNNVTTATTNALNKYILKIASQEQQENIHHQQQHQLPQQYKEKYQSYHCPTGKLCCLNVNVLPHAMATSTSGTNINNKTISNSFSFSSSLQNPMTNNNLSARTTTTPTNTKLIQSALINQHQNQPELQQRHQVNVHNNFQKILKNEWDILAHLTQDHQLPVHQFYAEYGQRLRIPGLLGQSPAITCLNLKGLDSSIEKFFIACIPLEHEDSLTSKSKVAIFMYHLNPLATETTIATISNSTSISLNDEDNDVYDADEVSNFETIIENPLTGIKWFGCAQPLTTPWSHILEKQHFLHHIPKQSHFSDHEVSSPGSGGPDDDDAFVIVVKRKLERNPKI